MRKTFDNAVVIGGSMAGLLAARVLADHFEAVTVIERDDWVPQPESRRGVPQGRHAHALLLRGQQTICRLFPGIHQALIDRGATLFNMGRDMRWRHFGIWKCRYHSALDALAASRPLIEWTVGEHVRRLTNVNIISGRSVESLIYDGRRISGVKLRRREGDASEEQLYADLVIDASGRGSHMPQYLQALGFPRAPESAVRINVGYATRIYRAPATPRDWRVLFVTPEPPAKRGALIMPMEGDRWMVTQVGMHGDHPPLDDQGYLAFAKSLSVPDVYDALRQAEPLSEIVRYGYPASVRRHYEKLQRFPARLLVLGDAVCSFNPVYGQGMSAASMYVDALAACLQERVASGSSLDDLWQPFFKRSARAADAPWQLATGEDFRFSETAGPRSPMLRLMHWYTRKALVATGRSPRVTERSYEVMHLLREPTALFAPDIMWQAMKSGPVTTTAAAAERGRVARNPL